MKRTAESTATTSRKPTKLTLSHVELFKKIQAGDQVEVVDVLRTIAATPEDGVITSGRLAHEMLFKMGAQRSG